MAVVRLVPVRSRHSFRRKRVAFSRPAEVGFISAATSPAAADKHSCGGDEVVFTAPEKSPLEDLPQDILIKIVCGVDHYDLKALFQVSKTVQEATLIAKKLHFEYITPKKSAVGLRMKFDFGDDEVEAPNAPRQSRPPRIINHKKLADISVALFASDDDTKWPRKQLFLHMKAVI